MSKTHFGKSYNLFLNHQIRACAEDLLEIASRVHAFEENEGDLILTHLHQLHRHAASPTFEEAYHPLLDLKQYFDITPIAYQKNRCGQTVVSLAQALEELNRSADHRIPSPLLSAVIDHVREEIRPNFPLHIKLKEVCRHQ